MTIPTTPMIDSLKAELDQLLRENAQIAVALSEQEFLTEFLQKTGMTEDELELRAEDLSSQIDEKHKLLRLAYPQAGVFELTIVPHGDEQDDRVMLEMVKWEPSLQQTMSLKEVTVSSGYYPEYYEKVKTHGHRDYHNARWLFMLTNYLDEFDVILFRGSVIDLSMFQKVQIIPETLDLRQVCAEVENLKQQETEASERMQGVSPEGHLHEQLKVQHEQISAQLALAQKRLRTLYLQHGVVEVGVNFHDGFGDGNVPDHFYLYLASWHDETEELVVYGEREVYGENNVFFDRLKGAVRYSLEMLHHILECSNFLYGQNIILFGGKIYDLNRIQEQLQKQ